MHKPKQQAIAFLLGALLVGGVVGFASAGVLRTHDTSIAARRKAMYDDLGLLPAQRAKLDSVFDDYDCQLDAIVKPLQPALDSIKAIRRSQTNAILTPEQRSRLDVRRKDLDAKHAAERKQIRSSCHK